MHNHKKIRYFLHFLKILTLYLPSLFWIFLIFGFDTPCIAILTIISATIHELGHIMYLMMKNNNANLRGDLSGFRITRHKTDSYYADAALYFSGPAANLISALIVLPFSHIMGEYALLFSAINLATAISNLMPIKGYDGYGIAISLLQHYDAEERFSAFLDSLSLIFITFVLFLSLYVMARIGDGYWTAGIFAISLIKEASEGLNKHFRSF